MKKALLILVLLIGTLGYGQALSQYQRHLKRSTADVNSIDTTRTDIAYTAIDSTLGIEVINWMDGNGWVPRITGGGGGSGDVLVSGTPVDNQIAVWVDGTTVEGSGTGMTYSGSGVLTIANGFNIGSGDTTVDFAGNDLRFNRTSGTSYISQVGGQSLRIQTTNSVASNTRRINITGGADIATISLDNSNVTIPNGDLTVTGNIAVSGTVDGRDIAADGAALDEKVDYDTTLANTVKIRIKDGDIMEDYILEVDTTAVASPIEWDEVPTNGSTKAVRSNGVYDAIAELSSSGTFTPTIVDDGGGATYTFVNQSTYYTIGNLVYTKVYFSDIDSSGTPSGNLRMTLGDLGTQLGTTLGGDGSYNINLALGVLDSDETKSYYVDKSGNDLFIYRVSGSFGIGSTPISARVVSNGAILLTGVFVKS